MYHPKNKKKENGVYSQYFILIWQLFDKLKDYSYPQLINDWTHIFKTYKNPEFFEYFRINTEMHYDQDEHFHAEFQVDNQEKNCRFGIECTLMRRNRRDRFQISELNDIKQFYDIPQQDNDDNDDDNDTYLLLLIQKLDSIHDYLYHSAYSLFDDINDDELLNEENFISQQSILSNQQSMSRTHFTRSTTNNISRSNLMAQQTMQSMRSMTNLTNAASRSTRKGTATNGPTTPYTSSKDKFITCIDDPSTASLMTSTSASMYNYNKDKYPEEKKDFVHDMTIEKTYCFGYGLKYGEYNKNHPHFVETKYDSLKIEITQNELIKISVKQFDIQYKRSEFCVECDEAKKMIAKSYRGQNDGYGIPIGSNITSQHILSLLLYTNFTELQNAMKKTLRKQDVDDDMVMLRERNGVYANWCRLLYESYAFFSTKSTKKCKYYHGINCQILFSNFHCDFSMPISTTISELQAYHFAGFGDGIILQFESDNSTQTVNELNVSWFSDFSSEFERLFYECTLKISDIILDGKVRNYKKLKILGLYDEITHGGFIKKYHEKNLSEKNQNKLLKLLEKTMKHGVKSVYDEKNGVYMNRLYEFYLKSADHIYLNWHELAFLNENLCKLFYDKEHDCFGEWIKYLQSNVHSNKLYIMPIFLFEWNLSSYIIKTLSNTLDTNFIITGAPLLCELKTKNGKYLVALTPYIEMLHNGLTKIALKLSYVSPGINSIKLSYNLNISFCESGNKGFYKHFSPVFMSIDIINGGLREYGEQHFENTSMIIKQVKSAIIIHELIDSNSKSIHIIKQQNTDEIPSKFMITSKSSIQRKYLNRISIFYALCNSLVSVMDVISDYYVLYSWSKFIEKHQTDSSGKTLFYVWLLSLLNILFVQIYYCYVYVMYNFNKRKQCQYKYWLGVISLLILSPLLPFLDSLGYFNKKIDFTNFLKSLGIPIYSKIKTVRLNSMKDEVRYFFRGYFSANRLIFVEITFESLFQLALQLIGLCVMGTSAVLEDVDELMIVSVSMIISLITMGSKALVMNSYSIHRICIIFNHLCWITDLFGTVSLTLWMASLAVVDANIFWYYSKILLIPLIISCIHCIFCDKLQIRNYTIVGYIIIFIIRLSFGFYFNITAHLPWQILPSIEHDWHNDSYYFYQQIIEWIKLYKGSFDYRLRIVIANYVLSKEYLQFNSTKIDDNDKFIKFLVYNNEPFQDYNDYQHLLNISLRQIREKSGYTFWNDFIFDKLLSMSLFEPFLKYCLFVKTDNKNVKYCTLLHYLCFQNAKCEIVFRKILNGIYLIQATLFLFFPFCFIIYPGLKFEINFLAFGTIFLLIYYFLLMILLLLSYKIYTVQHITFHLIPSRNNYNFQWSSTDKIIDKMDKIWKKLIEKKYENKNSARKDRVLSSPSKSRSSYNSDLIAFESSIRNPDNHTLYLE